MTPYGLLNQSVEPADPLAGIDPRLLNMLQGPGMAPPAAAGDVFANADLDNLRRILANDKGGAPIRKEIAPQSPQQILENLRRILRENG